MPELSDLYQLARGLLGSLLLPPAPLLVALLLALLLRHRARRSSAAITAASMLGLWLTCTDIGADGLQALLLNVPAPLTLQQAQQLGSSEHAVIWVLGAGAYRLRPEYEGPSLKPLTLERLRYGIWLARKTGLPLGFSGGVGWRAAPGTASEASLAATMARNEYGLPLTYVEDRSRDTRENASLSVPLLAQAGVQSVILVTHIEHMPRALRAFKRESGGTMEFIAAPVGARAPGPHELGDWLPTNSGFLRCRYVVYEWLGLISGH